MENREVASLYRAWIEKSLKDSSNLCLPRTTMRDIYMSSDRLVDSFKDVHVKLLAVDLVFGFIPF